MTANQTVLVTGGTGFVGSRLARQLVNDGHSVHVLGLNRRPDEQTNAEELRRAGAKVFERSVTTITNGDPALAGVDTIYHLAAIQHEMNVPDSAYEETNVGGTEKLLNAAIHAGSRRIVYVSTIGVWGETGGELSESLAPAPDTSYGRTKLAAEDCVNARLGQIDTSIVRLGETYGPGDTRLLKLFEMADRGRFLLFGSGRNRHHPIHVDDAIDAFKRAAGDDAAIGETFVIAGPQIVTSQGMMESIGAAVGKPFAYRSLPLAPMLAAAFVMERTLRPLKIQPPLHRRRLGFFTKDQTINYGKIASRLGFAPKISMRQGAIMTAEWYRNHGLLSGYSAHPPSASNVVPVT